jgi:hypothetical protein
LAGARKGPDKRKLLGARAYHGADTLTKKPAQMPCALGAGPGLLRFERIGNIVEDNRCRGIFLFFGFFQKIIKVGFLYFGDSKLGLKIYYCHLLDNCKVQIFIDEKKQPGKNHERNNNKTPDEIADDHKSPHFFVAVSWKNKHILAS